MQKDALQRFLTQQMFGATLTQVQSCRVELKHSGNRGWSPEKCRYLLKKGWQNPAEAQEANPPSLTLISSGQRCRAGRGTAAG